jgi:hypothetical protein
MHNMLRKAGNIIIVILLLMATGGLPVTQHYCGLVQKSVSFYATPKSCCADNCSKCHNVFKFSKVNDDFEAGSTHITQSLADVITTHTIIYIDLFNSFNIPLIPDLNNQRATSSYKAGHAPALLGNFRC